MRPPGTFKVASANRAFEDFLEPVVRGERRVQRILQSLRAEILDGDQECSIRVRRIFDDPCELFRLELDVPGLSYHRTVLLDREALEELLEVDDIRARVRASML